MFLTKLCCSLVGEIKHKNMVSKYYKGRRCTKDRGISEMLLAKARNVLAKFKNENGMIFGAYGDKYSLVIF